MQKNKSSIIAALKYAIPYIRLFKNKIFVIKASGSLFLDEKLIEKLIEQLSILQQLGIKIILIHGGGPQSSEMAASLGIKSKFIEGRRVTDSKMIDVTTMVLNGKINTKILAIARKYNMKAIGMSGIILNINADTVAASIAAEISAEKLILISSAPGILEDISDNSSLISYLDIEKLERLILEKQITDGMLPKSSAIKFAIEKGVERVHVISYRTTDSLLIEMFTNDGTGTLVVSDIEMLSSLEQLGGQL